MILPRKLQRQLGVDHTRDKFKDTATAHHLLRIGRRLLILPTKKISQNDPVLKITNAPPTVAGLSAWQRTLHRVMWCARLDAISNRMGLFEEALAYGTRPSTKAPPACEITLQCGTQGTKEILSEAVKNNPALDFLLIFAPRDRMPCKILGENYDPADPKTAQKIDEFLLKLVKLGKNGP